MRHRKQRGFANRFTSWRKATLMSMARNVLTYQTIKTTKAKAKAAQPLIEYLISLGKANTLAAKRHAFRLLPDHRLVSLLFREIAPRFSARSGGYTRILNLGHRRGDNAELVVFELTEIVRKHVKKEKVQKPEAAESPKQKPVDTSTPVREAPAQEKQKHPIEKKPAKKFFGGIRKIFKRERDSL
jgi:large subunit ribosomal protein L17